MIDVCTSVSRISFTGEIQRGKMMTCSRSLGSWYSHGAVLPPIDLVCRGGIRVGETVLHISVSAPPPRS